MLPSSPWFTIILFFIEGSLWVCGTVGAAAPGVRALEEYL